MQKIEAFLRPGALEQVQEALSEIGIVGMSVGEVRGFGRQRGHREVYRGAEYQVDFVPKVKMEVVVKDEEVDQVVDKIVDAAKTGQIGDGKVFVMPIGDAVRCGFGRERRAKLPCKVCSIESNRVRPRHECIQKL